MKKAVIGIVQSPYVAERIVLQLQEHGFLPGDISVLFSERQGTKEFALERGTKAPEAAVAGVGAGGVIGGALGLLAGIGALAIPGLGPFIAAGPIIGLLSGAAVGAGIGGIAGALIGMGIPEVEAKAYEGKVKAGNVLVAVYVGEDRQQTKAKAILELYDAEDVASMPVKEEHHEHTKAHAAE